MRRNALCISVLNFEHAGRTIYRNMFLRHDDIQQADVQPFLKFFFMIPLCREIKDVLF